MLPAIVCIAKAEMDKSSEAMRILFITLGDSCLASSRTRVYQYLPHLQAEGINTTVVCMAVPSTVSSRMGRLWWLFTRVFSVLAKACSHDVVFIQKVLLNVTIIRLLSLLNRRLVFDFDDAIYSVHQSVAHDDFETQRLKRFNFTVRQSALIVLENSYNSDYVRFLNPHSLIITGPIDTQRYVPNARKQEGTFVIGWIGSPANTLYLESLLPVFEHLAKHFAFRIKLIGAAPVSAAGVDIVQVEWDLATEVDEIGEFNIGIMPLPDDEWSRGKGGYKILQYMALGIPTVASPVGVNAEIIRDGENGFLARNEIEWYDYLALLIENHELCETIGEAARNTAKKEYSFFAATPRLITALSHLK